jgi:hypothetical protein
MTAVPATTENSLRVRIYFMKGTLSPNTLEVLESPLFFSTLQLYSWSFLLCLSPTVFINSGMAAIRTTAAVSVNITSDTAEGHLSAGSNHPKTVAATGKASKCSSSNVLSAKTIRIGRIIWFLLLNTIIFILFTLLMTTVVLHKLHDDYFYPLLKLMDWEGLERDFLEVTYYHRYCTAEDFTAKSVSELIIAENCSVNDAVNHMLTHGVSVYPKLLTNETAFVLRDWIVEQNKVQEGWYVIANKNRYSWGINMNMHPKLQTFWQELAANQQFLSGLESIVGPNPAIIEFTAITVPTERPISTYTPTLFLQEVQPSTHEASCHHILCLFRCKTPHTKWVPHMSVLEVIYALKGSKSIVQNTPCR